MLRVQENGVHALIIEDEFFIAMEIEDILSDLGFTSFDIALTPQDAIDAAKRLCPDLITSDVQLRPGCGISTVLTICECRAIPVIFLTGTRDEVLRRLPPSRVLSKPFSSSQLSDEVQAALVEDLGRITGLSH